MQALTSNLLILFIVLALVVLLNNLLQVLEHFSRAVGSLATFFGRLASFLSFLLRFRFHILHVALGLFDNKALSQLQTLLSQVFLARDHFLVIGRFNLALDLRPFVLTLFLSQLNLIAHVLILGPVHFTC